MVINLNKINLAKNIGRSYPRTVYFGLGGTLLPAASTRSAPPDMFTCHLIFLPLFVVIMIAGMLDEEVLFSNNLSLYGNLDITIWLKLDHMAPRKNHRASDY